MHLTRQTACPAVEMGLIPMQRANHRTTEDRRQRTESEASIFIRRPSSVVRPHNTASALECGSVL